MNARRGLKYWAFLRLGLREARTARSELFGSVIFLWVILGIFSALWRAVAGFGQGHDLDPRRLVWYLAATEWLVLSQPTIQFQLAEEVRRGDVIYQLAQPISYLVALFVRALGQLTLRAAVLAPAAVLGARVFSGAFVDTTACLFWVALFGSGALAVSTAFRVLLGLAAFPMGDIMPLFWVWQKLGFILGGLMLPLSFLPASLATVARFTPFPYTIYAPASLLLGEPQSFARLTFALAGWLFFALALGFAGFALARRRLELHGG
jgi:ABC-2 type transport system permease protein